MLRVLSRRNSPSDLSVHSLPIVITIDKLSGILLLFGWMAHTFIMIAHCY